MLTLSISLLLSFNNTKVRHFPLLGKLSKLYFSWHKVKYMLGLKKIIFSFIIINQYIFPPTTKGLETISTLQQVVNEIIIRPPKSEIFKGNPFSSHWGFLLGILKKSIKKECSQGCFKPFATFCCYFISCLQAFPVQAIIIELPIPVSPPYPGKQRKVFHRHSRPSRSFLATRCLLTVSVPS